MKKLLKENEFYRTNDIALATTISLWHPIEAIDKTNPRRVEFVFKRNKELDQLIESYWRGDLKIEPKIFFGRLRDLKTRLYQDQ